MKQISQIPTYKIVFFLMIAVFCNISVNAQDLKSRPNGNDLVKLNGTFDIPMVNRDGAKSLEAISAVIGDLDADGFNDLIIGRNGSLTIQRGDINAFAPQTHSAWEAIRDLRFISPFKSEISSFELPFQVDFVQIGDFTRDGKVDVIAASRSSNQIILLESDGRGGFIDRKEIFVSTNVTSLMTGDVGRLDGLPDLIVGAGNQVSIFQGAGDISKTEPTVFNVPNNAESIAVGQLDASDFADIAIGNGNQISIISGSDDENEVKNLTQNYFVRSLIVGDFVPDRKFRQEIATLDESGTVHILARGDLDTRPVSQKEQLADQVRELQAQKIPVPKRILDKLNKNDLRSVPKFIESKNQNWTEYDEFFGVESAGLNSSNVVLTSGKLSNYGEDIILLDSSNKEIVVMPLVFNEDTSEKVSYVGRREAVKLTLENSPTAAFVSRLNFDGDNDLLVLQNGKVEPTVFLTAPDASFTVNNAGDAVDANPGNGVCATSGGVCTLRAAIMEANRLTGNDSITINAGLNITLSNGKADNDSIGENSASYGDLDIFCSINASEDTCLTPNSSDNNDVTITGAVGGNTISAGTFSPSSGNGVTTDRVFDIGFDGVFGGGFGGSTGIDVTMSNLTIQNGNVREDLNTGVGAGNFARGGAIRMDGFGGATRGTLSLTNVTINNNQADHNTGGVFEQFANVAFTSVTATNNIGKAGGGGALAFLSSSPATLSVLNSTFTSNEARNGTVFGTPATNVGGGAIAANQDSNTGTISNTNFTNNISFNYGGALQAFNGAVTVFGGIMSGNTARGDGGAIWGDNDTVSAGRFLTLSGVTIRGNTANSDNSGGGDGGGVFRDRGTLNVNNSFIGTVALPNTAVNGGGIAHAFRAAANATNVTTINIDNGSVTGNNATTTGGGTFINSTNNATGIPSTLNIGATTSVLIEENNANLHGGGIAVLGGANGNLTRALIHGNDADKDANATGDGGAVYIANGTVVIPNTSAIGTATGNTAENGGGIYHSTGTLTITGTQISNNTVDVHGGGLFVAGGTVNVNGVTFAANTSTSGTEVRLTGGTTNFTNANTIPGELSIAGGTLSAGSSTINLGEDFHFSSGTFTAGTSTFNFNGSGTQQIYGGSVPTFNNLTDSNTANPLTVNNNINVNNNLTVNANAVLNPAAATVVGGTGTLTGNGIARVTRTASTADFLSQYTITNKTLTNLLVDYVGASAQTVSAITYGGLRINNASGASLASGTTTVGGTLTLQSGNLSVGTNTLTVNNGTSVGSGTFSSSATGTVNYNQGSGGQNVLAGNYGNLTFSNFSKVLPNGIVGVAGVFTPNSVANTITGNTFNFNGAGNQAIPSFTYNNLTTSTSGIKTTGTTVNVNGNATVGANTTLSVASGSTLTVTGTLTNNNIIQGTGTIANNFSNGGILSPGFSPGILNITGNFANTGSYNVEIGGTAGAGVNPNGHDQLLISGTATLGGTLNVTLTNGFTPAPGDTFLIIDGATSSGDFSTVNLPNIFPNVWRSLRNNATGTFALNVVGPTAAGVSIAGRVMLQNGVGVPNALVTITSSNGITQSVRANSFGNYRIENVTAGGDYTISVTSKGYTFASRVVGVFDEITGLNFIAEFTP